MLLFERGFNVLVQLLIAAGSLCRVEITATDNV